VILRAWLLAGDELLFNKKFGSDDLTVDPASS